MGRSPTTLEMQTLRIAVASEHSGGFFSSDRTDYLRAERMRAKGWLKLWKGRRSRHWSGQFFTITEAGRTIEGAEQ